MMITPVYRHNDLAWNSLVELIGVGGDVCRKSFKFITRPLSECILVQFNDQAGMIYISAHPYIRDDKYTRETCKPDWVNAVVTTRREKFRTSTSFIVSFSNPSEFLIDLTGQKVLTALSVFPPLGKSDRYIVCAHIDKDQYEFKQIYDMQTYIPFEKELAKRCVRTGGIEATSGRGRTFFDSLIIERFKLIPPNQFGMYTDILYKPEVEPLDDTLVKDFVNLIEGDNGEQKVIDIHIEEGAEEILLSNLLAGKLVNDDRLVIVKIDVEFKVDGIPLKFGGAILEKGIIYLEMGEDTNWDSLDFYTAALAVLEEKFGNRFDVVLYNREEEE